MKRKLLDTPRDKKAWCDVVNTPVYMPRTKKHEKLIIGIISLKDYVEFYL